MRLAALALFLFCVAESAAAGARDDQRLITGARGQLMPVVEAALAAGADLEAGDAAGRTALMWSAFHGNLAMLHYLIGKGADVNARDRRGRTALIWTGVTGGTSAATALLASGADVTAVDDSGMDAAAYAAAGGHAALAQMLSAE